MFQPRIHQPQFEEPGVKTGPFYVETGKIPFPLKNKRMVKISALI